MIASLPVELIARALEFVAPRDQCRSRRVCHLFKAAVVEVAYGYVERIIDAWNPLVNSEGPVAAQPIGLLLPVNVGETMVFEGGSVEAARFFKCVRPPPPIHCGALLHRALAGRRVALWPDDCLDGLGNVLRTWIGELQRRDRMSRSQLYGRKATEHAVPQPVATLLPLPTCTPGQLNDELRAAIDALRSMMTVMIVDQDLFAMNANPLPLLCSQLCGPGLSSTGSETAADWWSRDEQRLAVLPLNYIARHVNNAIELPPSVLLTHTSRGDVRANLAALLRTTVTPFRNVTFEFMDAAYRHAFQEMLRRPPWTGHVDLRRCDFSWVSFGEQSSIRSLQLPTSCHAAWGDAMVECKDLRVVDLSAVTSVGSYAFAACHALQRVRFSPLLIGIGRDAFTGIAIRRLDLSHCTKLECLEANAFSGCPFLADVCLPASITKLDEMCLSHLPSLISVDFGGELSQLTTISIRVFERCTALVQLGFPPRLETVGPICDGCTALKVLDFSRCVRLSRVAPQIVDHRARVLLRTDASVPVLRAFRRHNILLEVPL